MIPRLLPLLLLPALLNIFSAVTFAAGNEFIENFTEAKKLAAVIHQDHQETIYCPCRYHGTVVDLKSCGYKVHKDARRAARLEWEHVVPAEAFGQSFSDWREGTPDCIHKRGKKKGQRYKGRKCAEKNPEFARMESDLYNLWPAIGELNGLRSNLAMAQLRNASQKEGDFGGCKALIRDRKFEPMDQYKGIVARTYMYMESQYPGRGIISDKNRKLYEAWDKQYPVSEWECERSVLIAKKQFNENEVLSKRCRNVVLKNQNCPNC